MTTLVERRNRTLGPAYRTFYDDPVHIVRGSGVWLFDVDGNRYLDMYNNVPHVGHCNEHVVNAVHEQMQQLNTHTRYLHDNVVELGERLLATTPAEIDTAMFCCTGSEANELALRIAREATGGSGIVVTDFAYHGNTKAIHEITTCDAPVDRRPDYVATVRVPDAYRGEHRGADAGTRYADDLRKAVDTLAKKGIQPAAFVIDTIVSSGGVVEPPAGYLKAAAQIIREAGGLFIADEVQPGLGRTGSDFWGFEADGVVPDIITIGKPMGNGYPVSAMLARRSLVDKFSATSDYFNTFGGNPVACAAANAVLDVIEQDNLQENASKIGGYIVGELKGMQSRYQQIGDVRGTGLFIALELIQPDSDRGPDARAAQRLIEKLKRCGVLTGAIGPDSNILKLRSPLVLSKSDADHLLERIDECMR